MDEVERYYFTFLGASSFRDYYVLIEVSNWPDHINPDAHAREVMFTHFGPKWMTDYRTQPEELYAPKGCLFTIVENFRDRVHLARLDFEDPPVPSIPTLTEIEETLREFGAEIEVRESAVETDDTFQAVVWLNAKRKGLLPPEVDINGFTEDGAAQAAFVAATMYFKEKNED